MAMEQREEDKAANDETRDKLTKMGFGQGWAVRLSDKELGLLRSMLEAPEEFRREQIFMMCDFVDEDEALDHVAAYYEALDTGMDTGFNAAIMFSLTATNRKGPKTNRYSCIMDTLSHQRQTINTPKDYKKNEIQRGPLSG